jgi:RNA polymerase sporulation-specific sigma factor
MSYSLTEPTDAELAALVRSGDREAGSLLLARHHRLIRNLVGSYDGFRIDRDDLFQAGAVAFLRAAAKWDPARGTKLTTYAWRVIYNEVADEVKFLMRFPATFDPTGDGRDPGDGDDDTGRFLLDQVPARSAAPDLADRLERLTPFEQQVLRLTFGLDGRPVGPKELAARFGLSICQAVRLVEQALARARWAAEEDDGNR